MRVQPHIQTPRLSRRTEITSTRTTRTVPQAEGAVQQASGVAHSLSGRRPARLASATGPRIKANGIQRTAEHPTVACISAFLRTTGRRTTCPTPILIRSCPVRPLQPQMRPGPDQLPNRHRIFESLREIRSKRPTAAALRAPPFDLVRHDARSKDFWVHPFVVPPESGLSQRCLCRRDGGEAPTSFRPWQQSIRVLATHK